MVTRGLLDDDQYARALKRPQPPAAAAAQCLTDAEQQDAAEYFAEQRFAREGMTPREFHRWQAAADARERMEITAEARRQLAAEAASRSFPGFRALDLAAAFALPREDPPPLIEGLQRAGHKVSLVAQYKTGKTTFAANVVRSLVDEEPFLDRFHVPPLPGNVVVFDYELTDTDALDLYRAVGVRHQERVTVESLRGRGFTLANDEHAARTVTFLRERNAAYWVLDPFGRAMAGFGSENSNDEVRAFLMRVDEIVAEAGVLGVLLPVHTGRGEVAIGEERARGATVLDDDPDARWLLTRDGDGQRYFRAEGRSGISVSEFALRFDQDRLRLSSSEETRASVAGQRFKPMVLAYVREHPGASLSEIKTEVSGKDRDVAAAAKLLVADAVLETRRDRSAIRHWVCGEAPEKSE